MNDYIKEILRPRRETSAAEDEALVAQSRARGATSVAATELRNRLESARRGESIAREAQELFLRLLHFRTLLPGAAQDGEQRGLVLALFRQFRIAEEEYQVRFCGPDDEALMLPGRLDRFPPEVALDGDLIHSHNDAGRSTVGDEEEEEEEGPRVKMEVWDDILNVKVVHFGNMRKVQVEVDQRRLEAALNDATRSLRLRSEDLGPSPSPAASPRHHEQLSYEQDSRRGSPAAEAEYDAYARAPWESEDEDEDSGNGKQEETEPDLGAVLREQNEQTGIVDGAGTLEDDEEPADEQEEDLRADGYDSDNWLYSDSSVINPFMGDHNDRTVTRYEDIDDEAEDTYPDPANLNSDDWLYGPGYSESGDERAQLHDGERSGSDGDGAASVGTVREYPHAHARSMTPRDAETMHLDREASAELGYAMSSEPTHLLPALPPWSPQGPTRTPDAGMLYDVPGLVHHRPFYWSPRLRTPQRMVALHPFDHVARTPSPPPHPFTYTAGPLSPSSALYPSAAVAADDTASPSMFATSLESGRVLAQNVGPPVLPPSGVQRRQAPRGRGAHVAPYVRPTVNARQAWARSRIHDPSPMDTPVASHPIPVLRGHGTRKQRSITQHPQRPMTTTS